MIELNLEDLMLAENFKAIQKLKEFGVYSEEELQEMYNEQIKSDKQRGADDERKLIQR